MHRSSQPAQKSLQSVLMQVQMEDRLAARVPTPATTSQALLRFFKDHLWLMLCGIASECFYVFYLLRQFPLIHHEQELVDMGYLTNYSHTGFLTFLLCFSLLFALFLLAWREASRLRSRGTLWLVLGFGAVFALTGVFVYPVNAIDIYGYIAESAELLHHHANPLVVAATHYASDPLIGVASNFVSTPAPYGPVGILIDALPTLFAGNSLLANMLLLKSLFALFLLIEAYLCYRIIACLRTEWAIATVVAFAWNPYVILEYVVNSHNDIVLMLFVLLAIYAALKERHALAFVCVLLSVLVKYTSLPLLPLFVVYALMQMPTWFQRSRYLAVISVTITVLLLALIPFFWTGPQALASVMNLSQNQLYSLDMLLSDMAFLSNQHMRILEFGLFGLCYLYAFWLVVRKRSNIVLACFLTMFGLLAFALSYVQVWYLFWPCLLALLLPHWRMYVVAGLLSFMGTMVELVHPYVWSWGAYQSAGAYAIINSLVYLALFGPSIVLLIGCKLNDSTARLHA